MTSPVPKAFAGFTFDEWVGSRALMVGHARAHAETIELFSRLQPTPNGSQLSVEQWALFSLLTDDCAAKVERAAKDFHPSFREKLREAIEVYGSMLRDGILQSEFERLSAENGDDEAASR